MPADPVPVRVSATAPGGRRAARHRGPAQQELGRVRSARRARARLRVHGIEGDPEKIRRAFFDAYDVLFRRIGLFTALRLENLERLALQRKLDEIGEIFAKAANDEAACRILQRTRSHPGWLNEARAI